MIYWVIKGDEKIMSIPFIPASWCWVHHQLPCNAYRNFGWLWHLRGYELIEPLYFSIPLDISHLCWFIHYQPLIMVMNSIYRFWIARPKLSYLHVYIYINIHIHGRFWIYISGCIYVGINVCTYKWMYIWQRLSINTKNHSINR